MQLKFHNAVKPYVFAETGLLLLVIILALLIQAYAYLIFALLPLFLLGLTFFFFRSPDRNVQTKSDSILSPADGIVQEIGQKAEWIPSVGEVLRVGIYLSLWDVHINRIPVSGRIVQIKRQPGKYLPAYREEASAKNGNVLVKIENSKGAYAVQQVAGFFARRIVCDAHEGDRVLQGDIFGMIKFGSRVNLYLPVSTQILVKKGDRVSGGVTCIGKTNGHA